MGNGRGFYTDIGKKARDLLYNDYQCDHEFTFTTGGPRGVKITSNAIKKGDLSVAGASTQLKRKNITTDVKVDTSSNVKLQYQHKYAGISTSLGLTANPVLNFSGVTGNDMVALGTDLSFDTASGNFTKHSVGLSFTNADLVSSLTLNDKWDTVTASVCHMACPGKNAAVCGELKHRFSTSETTLTFGSQHLLDPLTLAKAKINSKGKVSALIQHEWHPKSLFTISGEVDLQAVEESAKIGLSFSMKH